MKNLCLKEKPLLLVFIFLLSLSKNIFSQVPIPDTATTGWPGGLSTLKWDNRQYLITTGNYNTYVTSAMSITQAFTIGTNRVTIVMGSGISTTGQNTTNTGYSNSYGSTTSSVLSAGGTTINAVNYSGNGTITLTFDTAVSHVAFSLLDVDNGQSATVTAKDPSGTSLNINMANAAALGTNIITGSGTTSAKAVQLISSNIANNSNSGTVNVYILGLNSPSGTKGVKSVTITMAGTSGDFWLSDVWACIYSAFPSAYYNVSKPYTNQPAYVLAVNGNNQNLSAVAISAGSGPTIGGGTLTTGRARYVAQDATATASGSGLNGLAYDPYNHIAYYTNYGNVDPTNKSLYKYSFNNLSSTSANMTSGITSAIISDITASPFNIPIFEQGINGESASFYNGSLYLGIEGINNNNNSGRANIVWRIDFNTGDSVPYQAAQVYAAKADNGSSTMYNDWGDIAISNDTMYSSNVAGTPYNGFLAYSLTTGLVLSNYATSFSPGQLGMAWNQQVYRFTSPSNNQDSLSIYNYNGTISSNTKITGNVNNDCRAKSGSFDESDAFLPPLDYGDAPSTYDPSSGDPATHDYDSTIRLGTYWNPEFAKKTSSTAASDNSDDGVSPLPIFTHFQSGYVVYVNVYNHSGSNATVAAWIDFNSDGVFSSSEGITATVSSSTSMQSVRLYWNGFPPISSQLITNVFMRIRVTSASNGMTISNPTGYYSNGEVEDYQLLVNDILPLQLISFSASAVNDKYVNIHWDVAAEVNEQSYIVQRSSDGVNWENIQTVYAADKNGAESYSYVDQSPLSGISFYRLKIADYSDNVSYSDVRKINITTLQFSINKIMPNPFHSNIDLDISLPADGMLNISLSDAGGTTIKNIAVQAHSGTNVIDLNGIGDLPAGIYIIEAYYNKQRITKKIIKSD